MDADRLALVEGRRREARDAVAVAGDLGLVTACEVRGGGALDRAGHGLAVLGQHDLLARDAREQVGVGGGPRDRQREHPGALAPGVEHAPARGRHHGLARAGLHGLLAVERQADELGAAPLRQRLEPGAQGLAVAVAHRDREGVVGLDVCATARARSSASL